MYSERAPYMSKEAGIIRMRVLLGFIESRSIVIDAAVQTEGTLHYLSIVCASGASPELFSRIMNKTAPGAIIEQLTSEQTRQVITSSVLHKDTPLGIPHALPVKNVMESRTQLLSLLLEYRALLAECRSFIDSTDQMTDSDEIHTGASRFNIPFVFFDIEGVVHGIPEFQIESLDSGPAGRHVVRVAYTYGPRVILCDDILTVSDINVGSCQIVRKVQRGYYEALPEKDQFSGKFILIVPSFL